MMLGIEIGGTKLQLAVGAGDGEPPLELVRLEVEPSQGAGGILNAIERSGGELLARFPQVAAVGIGFGGPVDSATGVVTKSHQISGWDAFPLAEWCRSALGRPAVIGNDCDLAALAEAHFGAGRGHRGVFYVTVGTGVGGGFVLDGQLLGLGRPACAEIGHLRPGVLHDQPEETVEAVASGWGIAAAARAHLEGLASPSLDALRRMASQPLAAGQPGSGLAQRLEALRELGKEHEADLLARCQGDPARLSARIVSEAAADGNELAADVLRKALETLGWALAQVVTLTAPEVLVVGGGVSLMGPQQFLAPLSAQIQRYVFPPLRDAFQLKPAALGELVVVHGALLVARQAG